MATLWRFRRAAPEAPVPADHRCRNCGEAAPGAYCPACGQETRLALPTARQFLREAAGRYVALDGRMWRTLVALLFRPGFLTREYLAGRRRRYVRPARLFLVLSLALFALLRVTGDAPIIVTGGAPIVVTGGAPDGGTALVRSDDDGIDIGFDDSMNVTVKGVEKAVPPRLKKRIEHFNALPRQEKAEQVYQGVIRYGPYALLGLLPAFAALLQVVYVGRRRAYPLRPRRYAEHLLFGAHNHAFVCLALMVATIPLTLLRTAIGIWIAVYFLWSMKLVYGGRWSGVLARALVVGLAYLVLFAFVVVGLLVAAVVLS
jgi:hypothetical protein